VTSVVSLQTFANSSNVPIVVFVGMQQEYVAAPRLLANSGIDRALDNCRKVLDHARRIGLPVAFVRMLRESAFFSRATPFARWIEGAFHRNHKVAYLCDASASHAREDVSAEEIHRAVSKISGLYGDVHETDDWIASTLPPKLGIGKNAGG
jgi:nicotinamidase-related amidase